MTKRKSPLLPFLSIVAIVCICLGIIVLAISLVSLQNQSRTIFGSPDPNLTWSEKIYYQSILLLNSTELTRRDSSNEEEVAFVIEPGESTQSVIDKLNQAGLITNKKAFQAYLLYRGLDTSLQAGNYQIKRAISPMDIAHLMQNASPGEVTFNILAGWRVEEISTALPTSGLEFSPDEFLAEVQVMPEPFQSNFAVPDKNGVEGFLMPGSYTLDRKTTAEQFILAALQEFERQMSIELKSGFKKQGLSLYQAVILASIVEREAIVDEEMPVIASVFLNRLTIDMELDSDPTVQYALGYNKKQKNWWTNPLTSDHLQIDSPYNTYLNPGLPPGPICNPGVAALSAVANPANTSYYYFRASCAKDGRHDFSQTFEEHLQKSCP
jgi:UPF0755 protein